MDEITEAYGMDTSRDRVAKLIVRHTSALSRIVKEFIPELQGYDLDSIVSILGGGSMAKAMDSELFNSRYAADRLDNLFDIRIPHVDGDIALLVNVEMNRSPCSDSELMSRAVQYCCSLISNQRDIGDDEIYKNIKKVYSIWLLGSPPEWLRGESASYQLAGSTEKAQEHLERSLINIALVGMDDPDRKSRSDFIRIISALLYPGLSMDKRMEVLKEMDVEVDSVMADNLKRLTADEYYGMIHTKKLIDEARDEGLAEGRAEERAKAEAEMMKIKVDAVLTFARKTGETIEKTVLILGYEDAKDEIIRAIDSMNDQDQAMESNNKQ